MTQDLFIVGTGGLAKEAYWLIEDLNESGQDVRYNVVGFISEPNSDQPETFCELPVPGNDDWALENMDKSIGFVPAMGNPIIRKKVAQKYLDAGFTAPTLIHPSVKMSRFVEIGNGTLIAAGATLTSHIKVGQFCFINLNSTVGHDCQMGDFVTIHPAANINGYITIGDCAEVGTSAVLLPSVTLGEKCVIGAGAVVTKDMPAAMVCMGVPCNPVRPL